MDLDRQRTIRETVVAILEAWPDRHHTGQEIADLARIEYKQCIDALNALFNSGRVDRIGSKSTARWQKKTEARSNAGLLSLEWCFLGIKKR